MHLFNDNSPTPPRGQEFYIWCPMPFLKTDMDKQEMGIEIIELYTHDICVSLISTYLEKLYQDVIPVTSLYAEVYKEIENGFAGEMEWTVETIIDEATNAEDTHPVWAENVFAYFNHDESLIRQGILDLWKSIHESICFPTSNMINMCTQHGLTLTPIGASIEKYGLLVVMEVLQDEYSYSIYESKYYSATPFGLGISPVYTTAEIGQHGYRSTAGGVRRVVHTTTPHLSLNATHAK